MRALVIGSSGGIGGALCSALVQQGYDVVGLSRSVDGLDITDEANILDVFSGLEGEFDRILVATGALELNGAGPEKSLRGLDALAMTEQFRLNALGPALILKHSVRLLPRTGRPSASSR